nr:hypothetical protein [uncultured Sphaerochaeta sp.]
MVYTLYQGKEGPWMFVQTAPKNKDGRVLMYFAEAYRENGKARQRTIERIGYVDEFTHLHADPIAHFKEVARQRTGRSSNACIP